MSFLQRKKIAILGGTGTLGKALVDEIANSFSDVDNVLIISRDEIKQLEMMEDYPNDKFPFLTFRLGDVRDKKRLDEVLNGYDYVIHAAAIKHVVMAERNPEECWKTNVIGTENVIKACKKSQVRRTLLISTDKAFRPVGVYGKSKLEAEHLFEKSSDSSSSFGVVRMGNIEGARGSVFNVFEKQKKNGVLYVTHPDATRFIISQRNAAVFVLESLESEENGPFIPKMRSIRIIDLARQIGPDCEIRIMGLRPGEKLHEELDYSIVSSPHE